MPYIVFFTQFTTKVFDIIRFENSEKYCDIYFVYIINRSAILFSIVFPLSVCKDNYGSHLKEPMNKCCGRRLSAGYGDVSLERSPVLTSPSSSAPEATSLPDTPKADAGPAGPM